MSHLSTIINRVKRTRRVSRDLTDEQRKVELYPHLLNLAEYMTFYKDYEPTEGEAAERLLAEHGMPTRVDATEHDYYNKVAKRAGIQNAGTGRCVRCGRRLSDPTSVVRGTGPVCAAKVERDFQRARAEQDDDETGIDPRLDAFIGSDA